MKKWIKIESIILLLLSLVGLGLRINMIYNVPTEQIFDFKTYYDVANNVYQGLGFTIEGHPIAFQGMGYSTILGLWFKLVGSNAEIAAKWLNVIMSMGTIVTVYYILKKITTDKLVLWLSMLLVIFLPQHIAYCNTIGTEVMSAFFLSGIIAIQVTKFNWKIKYPILGVAIGIMALTKPFFMAYPLLIAAVEWLKDKDLKETAKLLFVTVLAMIIVIAPWTLRNYNQFGRFIPISYNSGFNLYINNNPNNTHGGYQAFHELYMDQELNDKVYEHLNNPLNSVKIASDIELDFGPEAKAWIRKNPAEFLKLGVIRIHATYFKGAWDIETWAMNEHRAEEQKTENPMKVDRHLNFIRSVSDIFLYIISSLGLLFIILHFKDIIFALFMKSKKIDPFRAIVFLNLSYVSLVYFVYEGQSRYNFIVLFLLIMAASHIISNYNKHKHAE